MPAFLKVLVSLAIEVGCIILGGAIGVYCGWLPGRDIPARNATPADGLGMAVLFLLGMMVGAVVGICGVILFWRRAKSDSVSAPVPLSVAQNEDKDIWPPPPNLTV